VFGWQNVPHPWGIATPCERMMKVTAAMVSEMRAA
jgi:hypothetical protein